MGANIEAMIGGAPRHRPGLAIVWAHLAACLAVLTTVIVIACSPGQSRLPPSRPLTSPSAVEPAYRQTPGPRLATPSPPALVIPTPQGPFRRCEVSQLEAQLISIGAAAGNVQAIIELRNRSAAECDLYGYAGIQLLDSGGQPLPTRVRWTTSSFFPPETPLSVVALPPDTSPITSSRPTAGHAYIAMSWDDVVAPCEFPSQLMLTPADSYQSITISATPPGGTAGQLTVCSGGSLSVKPVRPAMNP